MDAPTPTASFNLKTAARHATCAQHDTRNKQHSMDNTEFAYVFNSLIDFRIWDVIKPFFKKAS